MKKILAITAMAAFAAASFAEGITFGAWMRALAAPAASNGEETITAAGNSWGGPARVGGLNITGVAPDGNAGFNMAYRNNADKSIALGDEGILWVKPIDIVKVSYGFHDNNTLRGDVCYGSWNWMRPTAWIQGDDGLLMSGNGKTGLMVEVTPMEELYIQATLPITGENVKAGTTYKNIQAGFAYTVPGLVKVKAQYIGSGSAKEKDYVVDKNGDGTLSNKELLDAAKADGNSNSTIEAEIDVLAVEGLFAGVGFQYNNIKDAADLALLENAVNAETIAAISDPKEKAKAVAEAKLNPNVKTQMKIAAGASYQVTPELKVSASGAFFTYYKVNMLLAEAKIDPRFQAGLGVDYDLGDGLAANADFRYVSPIKIEGEKTENTDHIAFSVGVQKNVSSNGYIGVAFQGITNSGSLGPVAGSLNDKNEAKNFTWAIPVVLSVTF